MKTLKNKGVAGRSFLNSYENIPNLPLSNIFLQCFQTSFAYQIK